jgi:hypothetical protein
MKTALVRLGRCYDPTDIAEGVLKPGTTVYDRGCFYELSRGVRILVDHDDAQQVVGRVREFAIFDDLYGGRVGRWHFALVDADLPGWVRAGTGVSIGPKVLRRMELGGMDFVRRAVLDEISFLTHRMKPLNVGAQVMRVSDAVPAVPPKAASSAAARAHSRPAAVDLSAWLTPAELAQVAAIAREGLHMDAVRSLVEQTVRPRMARAA